MPESPTWIASLTTTSPWLIISLVVVARLPQLLHSAIDALAHLVALYSRVPARRRAAHRVIEHRRVSERPVSEPGEL